MISGVVLARNEALNIKPCLRSFAPHVDDLILIDMESEDRTVELARPLVTKILSHPLIPNFDSARNIAIAHAKHDWIWFLDADERISDATGHLVNVTIRDRGDEFVALTIPFKTFFCGQWIEHCGWWPGYTMPRVLKRGHFRFGEELHSGVKFDGPELRVAPREDLAIEHFSYRSVEHYIEKLNRYTTGEALTRHAKGAVPDWQRGIREMVRDLWIYYERNQGALDGYRGWVLSWLSGQYRWLTEAKLLDTTTVYDEAGRALASLNALGFRNTSVFDTAGRTAAQIDALGNRWSTIFDEASRQIANVDPLGNRNTLVYDSAGRTKASIDALGNRTGGPVLRRQFLRSHETPQ